MYFDETPNPDLSRERAAIRRVPMHFVLRSPRRMYDTPFAAGSAAQSAVEIIAPPSYNFTYNLHLKLSRLLRPLTSRFQGFNDKPTYKRLGYGALALLIFGSSFYWLSFTQPKKTYAASQGPNSAAASGDCVNDAGIGATAWTNPGNAFSNNATYAQAANLDGPGTESNYIKCTNFGFTLPTTGTTTIDGIVVAVERKSDSTGNGGSSDEAVRIVKGGTIGTTDRATATTYLTTDVSENHGGTTDLWGETWTAADINASNFGTAFAAEKDSSAGGVHNVTVDHITITVYYTHIPSLPSLTLKGYIWENDEGGDSSSATSTEYPVTVSNDTGIGSISWGSFNSVIASDDVRAAASLPSTNSTSNYIKTTNYGFLIPANATISGIRVLLEGRDNGAPTSDYHARLIKNGTILSTDKSTDWPNGFGAGDGLIPTPLGGTSDLWSETWTPSDINNSGFGAAVYGVNTDTTNNTIAADSISIEVTYSVPEGTQLAAANTGITMRKGERVTLRAQLRNTGGPLNSTDKLGLFYDRGDGLWTKVEDSVKAVTGNGSGCSSTAWTCTVIDDQTDVINSTTMAFSPSGIPYVGFQNNSDNSLGVAEYVGSGGNCDTYATGSAGSDAWQCTIVDDQTDNIHANISLAISPSGIPYFAYHNNTDNSLIVANYVGSGGNCDTYATGSTGSDAWQCTIVDDQTESIGHNPSLAFSASGTPYVAYRNLTAGSLIVASLRASGSGGNCDTYASGSTGSDAWDCTVVDNQTNSVGSFVSIAVSPSGNPYVSHNDGSSGRMIVSNYVGSGGNCDTYATGSAGSDAWQCTIVDDPTDAVGLSTSIAFSPSGTPYVTYTNTGAASLIIASLRSTGSGGNCDTYATGSAGSDAWDCTVVDNQTDNVGTTPSIAFSPSGMPYIAHRNLNTLSLIVSSYVGSGGNCDTYASGSTGSDAWDCAVVDDQSESVGGVPSLAFSPNGAPFISHLNLSDASLMITQLHRAGEITLSPSYGGSATLTESHADMTAYDNSANRDDADCITSGTWNNGRAFIAEEGSGFTIADGQSTPQCTEVAWTLDTSQAQINTTYRFMIATDDAIAQYKGKWRGPIGVESYPTLTIEDDSLHTTTQIASKDALLALADCNDTTWGCDVLDNSIDDTGLHNSVAFSANGVPYISYYDTTLTALMVAQYVGSGGTGCGTSGSSAWTCTTVDNDTDSTGTYSSIAFSPDGAPYVSYRDATNNSLMVAQYVGSGGSGCGASGSSAWTCTTIDILSGGQYGYNSSIAFNSAGVPHVAHIDGNTNTLRLSYYVGSGGNCDSVGTGSDAWNCTSNLSGLGIESAGLNGVSLAFSPSDTPYIAYLDSSISGLGIAQYVGAGGSGCADSGWTCTVIDNDTDQTGSYPSLAFDPSGVPYISYYDLTNTALMLATYVGGASGSGCGASGSNNWNCVVVDQDSDDTGQYSSLAFSPSGVPYISFMQEDSASHVKVARYVGSSGSGCGASGSAAWSCSVIDNTAGAGLGTSIAFSPSGIPYVAAYDIGASSLRIAAYKGNVALAPTFTNSNTPSSRNGYRSSGRFTLNKGTATASGNCTGAAGVLGLCGITTEDGQYDSITATANERPVYLMKARFDNNAALPTLTWAGTTSLAPNTSGSTGDLVLQVYRYGSTNAWENVSTNSTSSDCSSGCVISGLPSGTASEYFQADGSNYNVYFRIYQVESTSSPITFKTDSLKAIQQVQQMRHGRTFNRSMIQPFVTEQR